MMSKPRSSDDVQTTPISWCPINLLLLSIVCRNF
jgi:hypothetical protein